MTHSPYRLREHVSLAETDDGAVLLDEVSGRYWQLNNTGSLIVRTLVEGGDAAAATQALVRRYGVSEDLAAEDVAALVEQLTSAKLVVTA